MLLECNELLKSNEEAYDVHRVRVEFLTKGHIYRDSWISHGYWNTRALERKEYRNVDIVLLFVAAFIDQAEGCPKRALMTVAQPEYSALVRFVMNRERFMGLESTELTSITDEAAESMKLVAGNFQDHRRNRLFTLKFQLLDHLTEDIEKLERKEMLHALLSERYNAHVNRACLIILKSREDRG